MSEHRRTELNSFDTHRDGSSRVRDHETNSTEPQRPTRRRVAAANSRQTRRRSAHREPRSEATEGLSTGTPEALDLFLRRARVHPLLTAAEEVELAKRLRARGLAARRR